jgi:hypothetical protein
MPPSLRKINPKKRLFPRIRHLSKIMSIAGLACAAMVVGDVY